MSDKTINSMTRKEFEAIPYRKWDEDIGLFDSLVILPERRKHDSGYRCISFVAVKDNKPLCKMGGCSDVIHLDGIGGYGIWDGKIPETVSPKSWSIDFLPVSGLARVFAHGKLKAGLNVSSFEIFCVKNGGLK